MKKPILSLLLLIVAITLSAAERSNSMMRRAAVSNLNASTAKVTLSKPTLDVYNDGKQFAIVSRDDRFPAVLAYGMGNFDIEKAPDNVKWWFEAVQRSMDKAIKQNTPRRADVAYTPVAPMMTTKWGQDSPYNNMCPRESGDEHDTESPRSPSGCVATAMAQIMNYQQYPASVKFTGRCYLNGGEEVYDEREIQSTYSWPYLIAYGSYLPDGYTSSADVQHQDYNFSQAKSIATLLRDCGYAANMSYTQDGSGASVVNAGIAFIESLKYPLQSVKYWDRMFFSDKEWMDLLQAEMMNGCPVLYGGFNSDISGGHAFVLHGMDAEGKMYVNWGWYGAYDGYYAIDLLTPSESDDFSYWQDVITGIRPEALATDVARSLFVTHSPYKFSYDKTTTELRYELVENLFNNTLVDFVGRLCVVIENESNPSETQLFDFLEEGEILSPLWGLIPQKNLLGKGTFPPGTYRIYFASKADDEESWQYARTVGGPIYYEATVGADGKMTISETPTYISGSEVPSAIREVNKPTVNTTSVPRYFDLQGREVNGSTKGLIIRRQGDEVKKVLVK